MCVCVCVCGEDTFKHYSNTKHKNKNNHKNTKRNTHKKNKHKKETYISYIIVSNKNT